MIYFPHLFLPKQVVKYLAQMKLSLGQTVAYVARKYVAGNECLLIFPFLLQGKQSIYFYNFRQ